MQIALKKSIFQQIIDFIFDVNFITLGMLVVCSARAIETQTLYFHAYPKHLDGWPRYAASWFMALAFELTATIVTVNEKHNSSKKKTIAFAWASVIMTALFLLDVQQEVLLQKIKMATTQVFLSCVSGYMVFVYADLFTQKAREKILNIDFQVEVNALQNKVSKLDHELSSEKNKVTQTQFLLNEAQQKVNILEEDVEILLTQKQGLEVELETQRLKASRKKDKEQLSFSIVKKAN